MRLLPLLPIPLAQGVAALGYGTLLLALLPGRGAAEENSFSAGLQQLGELGMPAMQGARWVTVADEEDELESYQYMLSQIQANLKGNAWQLPTDPPTHLGLASLNPVKLGSVEATEAGESDEPSLADKIRAYANRNAPQAENKEQDPDGEKKTLLQQDVARIIKALRKDSTREEINQSMEWGGYDELVGGLLLFAVQIHLSGDTETANQLAGALFQTIDDNTAVIDLAVNMMAEHEYQGICSTLYESADWDGFLTGLKGVLQKYPRGWKNRPAVDMLAARVAARSHTPVPQTIEGIEIDAEAHALVTRLTEKPEGEVSDDSIRNLAEEYGIDPDQLSSDQRQALLRALMMGAGSHNQGRPWLLEVPEVKESSSVSERIKALGMRALPALAAVVEDETLTLHPNSGSESYGGFSEEGPETLYRNLSRPSTRGELACQLLQSVIPVQSDPYQSVEVSPDMLRELALDLWRRHKDSPTFEIAALYLREGQHQMRQSAATYLTESDNPEAHQAFEEAILKADDPLSMLPHVEQYLSHRKAKAGAFGKAFIKILQDGKFDEETLQRSPMGHSIQRAGGMEKYINTLLLKVGDVSLTKLIEQALAAKQEPGPGEGGQSAILALSETIGDVELDECMRLFAKVADRASPRQWEDIHAILLQRAELASDQAMEEDTPVETIKPETLQAWVAFTKRDTPLALTDHRLAYMRMLGCQHIGDVTTFLIDLAAGKARISEIYQCSRLFENATEALPFCQQRVTDLLEGKTPTPWPSGEAVPGERREEILKQLGELPAAQLLDYARALSMDERSVVLEFSAMHQMSETAPKNLVELNSRITTLDPVYRLDHDAGFVRDLAVAVGDPIDDALVLRIADRLLAEPERYGPSSVMILRGPMELGSTIQASTPAIKKRDTTFDYNMRNVAMMMSRIEDHDEVVAIQIGRHFWMRALTDGKADWIEADFTGNSDQRPELDKAMKEEQSVILPIMITLMTRKEAQKTMKQSFNPY